MRPFPSSRRAALFAAAALAGLVGTTYLLVGFGVWFGGLDDLAEQAGVESY